MPDSQNSIHRAKYPLVVFLTILIGIPLLLLLIDSSHSGSAKETPLDPVCERNLRWIGEALSKYKKEHGAFPPSVSADASGNQCSWRVVLAPYLFYPWYKEGEESKKTALGSYRFDQAWNSDANMQWAGENARSFIRGYLCPGEIEYDGNYSIPYDERYTSYLMLDRSKKTENQSNDILPDDAIIVVESLGSGILWHEPRDVSLDKLLESESPFGLGRLNATHPLDKEIPMKKKFIMALRADGKVIHIPVTIDKTALTKLLLGGAN